MGLNTAMLYTEDTYESSGRAVLRLSAQDGTLRRSCGNWTPMPRCSALRCSHAFRPLAHLEQILQWPAYDEYKDTDAVLIADEDKTYELLEKMIAAASAPFKSKRIHIGMDEAHGIGSGRYKKRHGVKSPFDILNGHLGRVSGICSRLGLKPMIWSDMYFRLGSKSHDYYDLDAVVPPEVIASIPKDARLVYWDYYHLDKAFYADFIDRHRALGSEPRSWLAGFGRGAVSGR